MATWQEPTKPGMLGWSFPYLKRKVGVAYRGYDVRQAPFEGHFLRYEGAEDYPCAWWVKADDWFELWPHEPMKASSMEEAKAFFTPLLPQIEDGSWDERFDKKPYTPPIPPQALQKIEHPTHLANALIIQRPNDAHYELCFRVYAPDGKYFPVQTPSIGGERGWDWGRARTEITTLADDLASAEQAARVELDEIVQSDPEIMRREQVL